jgi:hypothetical protein
VWQANEGPIYGLPIVQELARQGYTNRRALTRICAKLAE